MTYEIIQADVLDALRQMPDASADAVLTDPPYGLGTHEPTVEEIVAYLTGARLDTGGDFMSKKWELPSVEVWRELMRVLRPGAHVLAFGGTRTFDLLAVGLRAAGFERRDCCSWMYSSGFPKSLDVSKAIDGAAGVEREVIGEKVTPDGKPYSARRPNSEGQYLDDESHISMSGATRHDSRLTAPASPDSARFEGWGTALKPAWEPVLLVRKPIEDTVAANALAHGTGGLNIDGTRISYVSDADRESLAAGVEAIRERGGVMNNSWKNSSDLSGANPASPLGRWPANVVLSHSLGCKKISETEVQAPVINRFTDGMKPFGGGAGHPYEQSGGGTETIPVYECEPDCPVRLLNEQSGSGAPQGRWPANVVLSHSEGCRRVGTKTVHGKQQSAGTVGGYGGSSSGQYEKGTGRTGGIVGDEEEIEAWECVPDCPVRLLDEQSGDRPSGSGDKHNRKPSSFMASTNYESLKGTSVGGDSGGASRFFATFPADGAEETRFRYVPKASRAEREFGCEHLPARTAVEAVDREPDSAGAKNPRAGAGRGAGAVRERCAKCGIPVGSACHERQRVPCVDGGEHEPVVVGRGEMVHNHHPCLKPIALARWLATLLLPPPLNRPRRILVPFSGSGSEMIGAIRAGFEEVIGVERERDYCDIASARLERWSHVPLRLNESDAVSSSRTDGKKKDKRQMGLF
jgi:site-specific DNA-methyltransferase (adenine-specific)